MSTLVHEGAAPAAAPSPRQQLLGQIERALRSFAERLRRRREAILAYEQIAALDAATLRDLGLYRSETGSVVAEMYGQAEATRWRVLEGRSDPRLL